MNLSATPAALSADDGVAAAGDGDHLALAVKEAAVLATCMVAESNGGNSNAPNGPFQTKVFASINAPWTATIDFGPMSSTISASPMSSISAKRQGA